MNNLKIKNELHKKMQNEFSQYIDSLKKESTERVINRAYEISMKKEFLALFEPSYIGDSFTEGELNALLHTEHPLDELYSSWIHCDLTYFDVLEYSCHASIEDLTKYTDFNSKMQTAENTKDSLNANNSLTYHDESTLTK